MPKYTLYKNYETLDYDYYNDGSPLRVANIFKSAKMVESYRNDPFTHQEYDIKDGETPEIISDLYYLNVDYAWTILVLNNIKNYYEEWPMSSYSFESLIDKKYGSIQEATNMIHYYEDPNTGVRISEETYDYYKGIAESTEEEPDSISYARTVKSTYKKYTKYQYEFDKNEKNRRIKVLKQGFVRDFVDEYRRVISL